MSKIILKEFYHEGVRLCRRNARFLLRKASETFDNSNYHAAYLLGFASMEEVGKALVILNHWDDDHITSEQYRDEIRNHPHKIALTLRMIDENMVEFYARTPRWAVKFKDDTEKRKLLVDARTESIYVDFLFTKDAWKKPHKKMEKLAEVVIINADFALSMFGNELRHRNLKIPY